MTRLPTVCVVGLGAGGHGRVVAELLGTVEGHVCVGWLDADVRLHGTNIAGFPVLGGDDQLAFLKARGIGCVFMGIGSVGTGTLRERVYAEARRHDLQVVTLVHPTACVSVSAMLGQGTVVLATAVINVNARVGENVIINSGAIVEHDCVVGAHSHVAPRACLSGQVEVGEAAFVGAGAVVRQGVRIGKGALIGAGAVVLRDVPDNICVVGNPARPLVKKDRPVV